MEGSETVQIMIDPDSDPGGPKTGCTTLDKIIKKLADWLIY
jgi:hypothetical protein